jgi:hypothetical protein
LRHDSSRWDGLSLKRAVRKFQLKRKYGLTLEEYDALLEEQAGGCAICGGTNPSGFRLAVDHNHETGEVRGLLCTNCNFVLGYSHDDPALLRKTIRYLES